MINQENNTQEIIKQQNVVQTEEQSKIEQA